MMTRLQEEVQGIHKSAAGRRWFPQSRLRFLTRWEEPGMFVVAGAGFLRALFLRRLNGETRQIASPRPGNQPCAAFASLRPRPLRPGSDDPLHAHGEQARPDARARVLHTVRAPPTGSPRVRVLISRPALERDRHPGTDSREESATPNTDARTRGTHACNTHTHTHAHAHAHAHARTHGGANSA